VTAVRQPDPPRCRAVIYVHEQFVVRPNFASYQHLDVRIEDLFATGDRVAARIVHGRAGERWGAAV